MAIYFVVQKKESGSSMMRANQIATALKTFSKEIEIIEISEIKRFFKKPKSYFIWIGPVGMNNIYHFTNRHVHILDVVDKYLSHKKWIDKAIRDKVYDILFVNNKFMRKHFKKNMKFQGKVHILHHHYDPRYETCITTIADNQLRFGYIGSILSLLHTNNFLHYKRIGKKYNVQFLDTENAMNMNGYVFQDNKLSEFKQKKHALTEDNIPKAVSFNCQVSIRPLRDDVSKYKTTAKIATAVVLGHNIITTYEESVKDILPEDYPFLLRSTDFQSVDEMFQLVTNDFYSEKKLWNKGLSILKEVREKLDVNFIAKKYKNILKL